MNCANHPDVAVAAYCQTCGKPLCTQCMRTVGGVVYCEPCLAARVYPLNSPVDPGAPSYYAHPLLAGLLGFIPGVGAMYNGQFVKALAHVLIFGVFVSLADKSFVFGLLIAAWVFYQVFDAAQTAKARRDGLPLPNPFGLNDIGARLGMTPAGAPGAYAAGFAPPPPPAPGTPYAPPGAGTEAGGAPPGGIPGGIPGGFPGASPGPYGPYSGPYAWSPSNPPPVAGADWGTVPPPAYGVPPAPGISALPVETRRRHPVGAIVLIVIGVLLLLQTLGVFEEEWIGRAWPLALIGIGGWLLYSRTRDTSKGGF